MQLQTQIGDYKIDYSSQLGKGQFGKVFGALKISTQQNICVKQIKITLQHNQILQNEMIIVEKLKGSHHNNIVNIFDVIEDNQNLNIFMELCNGDLKDLFDKQSKEQEWFTLEQIKDFINQIVLGYLHLKKLGIVHRDLKPENILFYQNINQIILKISDFGTSKAIEDQLCTTKTGTPFYQAPEIFTGNNYDDKCDVYSLGIIIYQLAYKNQKHAKLTNVQELTQYLENIRKSPFQCPEDPRVPQELRQLIQMMIVYDPNKRINWDSILSTALFNRVAFIKNYFIDYGKTIGQQGRGQLFQCQDYFNKEIFVAKFLPKSNDLISQNGIRIYRELHSQKHPNIQTIIEVIQCVNSQDYYIIMEKCELTLFEYMRNKTWTTVEIKKFVKQIANGYLQLKQLNILHRDLKPVNIVVFFEQTGQPTFKVFYLSNQITGFETGRSLMNNEQAITNVGIQYYTAPELNGGKYNYQCDIFSLGIIIHQLHFRMLPKNIQNQQQLISFNQELAKNNVYKCNRQNKDQNLCNLIEQMIVYNPDQRITWENLQKSEYIQLIKPIINQQIISPNIQFQKSVPQFNLKPKVIIQRFCIYQYLQIVEELASQIYQEMYQSNHFQILLPSNMHAYILQTLSLLQYYVHYSIKNIQQYNRLQIRTQNYTSNYNSPQQNKFNPQIWLQNYQRDTETVSKFQYEQDVFAYQQQQQNIQIPCFLDYLEQLNELIQYLKYQFAQFLQRNPSQNAILLLFKIVKLSNFCREYPLENLANYNAIQFNFANMPYPQQYNYIASSLQ